ncbi:hypothetical protein BH721_04485 [Clostridium baratii]|uniref:replicative DNA helicase n=1 Tax=Clostridium baratii TaxID=1561 RepID=UPI0009A321B2|nr:DnaB-like helicase C-terminal domain-containing protein [Clostridium baratii]OPF52518.1 hypothetical protein A1M12_10690 [Clostridium baratii]OPF55966.1 hypothetical protein BH721_04485 [Clostridium baratii]OPF58440.1 hypothetical protein BH724_06095 [Clostridium baratii]OPF59652.1 hypothetical protein BH725_03440 [Clostridium baratii]
MIISENIRIITQEIIGGIINDNSLLIKAKEKGLKSYMILTNEDKQIYRTISEMINKGMSVDLRNLLNYMNMETKNVGGITYITEISECSPTNENFETKIDLLINEYKKKEIYEMSKKVQGLNTVEEMTEVINKTLESVYKSDVVKDLDICNQYEEYLNNLYSDSNEGFKTGLNTLDRTIGNLQRGRLVTLFARSGVGKSTVAIQIALNLILQGYKTIYGSGEMSVIEVLNKMASSELNIEYQKINKKILTDQEKDRITSFINNLMNKGFYITNETDINKVISEIKLYKLNNGLDVLFIDYVNKYVSGMGGMSLTEKIGQVTSQLKDLALKEDICIVLLAQANRRTDINESKNISEKITESDIQDSARIEQDSDQVISLYRNKKFDNKALRQKLAKDGLVDYSSRNADKNPECINLTILKNRHGEKNTLAFRWQGEYSRVSNFMR